MRRRLVAALVFYSVIVLLIAWPVVRAFGAVFPHDAGDPVLNSWILWWSTRRAPFTGAWWNAPMFFPMRDAMALSEVLVGILPISVVVQALTGNPVAAYNAAFLLSFPLCGVAAYALAFELTGRRGSSLAAGIAYAFAPYRMGQFSHLQVLSYYWAPLALMALHRYVREQARAARWLVLFAFAWLMQSLCNGYAMFHVAVLLVLWITWFARPRGRAVPIVLAWAVAALVLAPMLLHYQQVHRALHLVRDINETKRYSADLTELFSPSPELAVWGGRLVPSRAETTLFPGATILVAAATAVLAWWRRRRQPAVFRDPVQRAAVAVALAAGIVSLSALVAGPWAIPHVISVSVFHKPFTIAFVALVVWGARTTTFRTAWRTRSPGWFYAVAAVAMYVLALGPVPTVHGHLLFYEPPYAWLMRLPGFSVLRVPARFAMVAVLCQSAALALLIARWSAGRSRRWIVPVACVGLLIDGWTRMPVASAPAAPPSWSDVDAVIELPAGEPATDFPAIYRGMLHGRPIVNGFSGYAPPHYLPLVFALRDHRFEVLPDLAPGGRIGVSLDKSRPESEQLARDVAALPFATGDRNDDRWRTFIVSGHAAVVPATGAAIPFTIVSATVHPEDTARLHDGNLETAWGSGEEQVGTETIVVDAGQLVDVGAIVFQMGAFSFGFPRELAVDVSADGAIWTEAWRGPTVVEAFRAALRQPGAVPLTIGIGRASGRYIRLRQLGREARIPWWIAELEVRAAVRDTR